MPRYEVRVRFHGMKAYEVEAPTEEEAEDKATDELLDDVDADWVEAVTTQIRELR